MTRARATFLLTACAFLAGCPAERDKFAADDPHIYDLADLSVETLRARQYGSKIKVEHEVPNRSSPSYMTSYDSDGLRVYARVDLPATAAPKEGYPVVIFVHGWVGTNDAPGLDFYYDGSSNYGQIIDAYVAAGFAVLVPGWRGHGTIDGVAADGIEFMRAWDNGSYVSPVFYAIDVLNLLDSVASFKHAKLDLHNINMYGHSQGGDVALMALAIAGEGSKVSNNFNAASIWSGNIPTRFVQLSTFWPMQTSPQAFMSGDGSWNGTAIGADGSINPHFVFGYPADWIGSIDTDDWTWQNDTWSNATVAEALVVKLDQMYAAVNEYVIDYPAAHYEIVIFDGTKTIVAHEAWVIEGLSQIGAFDQEQYLSETLALHHSDRDFYSLPDWNADLCRRANGAGGLCFDFTYPGNTHSLRLSEHEWFSPSGSQLGFEQALRRDIALFGGADPREH
ncbi:MAG: alpha/beta hydrolase family protein [Woeseiaceae bacterium]